MRQLIDREASLLGFQHVRVASVGEQTPRIDAFDRWLGAGHHGEMHYLPKRRDERADVRLRLQDARSAVVLALEHHHRAPPDPGGLTGQVARYAWGRDYHNLVGKRLRKLQRRLREQDVPNWGGVDTAPILERAWAEAAGLGFSGKNCLQILPAHGSWMFLAVLFVEAELQPDTPLGDHCGSCRRCLDICPTGAFVGPRTLDARRCIAYWTIETRGVIPVSMRPGIGRWAFGCDACQEVCPHNVSAPDGDEDDLLPRNAWLDLPWLLESDDDAILARFQGTPIRRPGADALRRNACIVLGNLGDTAAVPVLRSTVERASPLVVEHARWALERLGG